MLQPPNAVGASTYGPPSDPIQPLREALRGRYEIERQIGQGAYATVFLARDLKHERKVALKVLNADPTSETGEIRFVREIRTLARLQHPNILPLHDSGHVEALLYYVMPYVSGDTLRDRMDRERVLSVESACAIGRDIADALAYAHGQGVVHRDIKPENILLSGNHPVVADFGIARIIDVAGVRQLTKTGMGSPGTPAYMSPEQLLGDRQVDGRSDIYSLGCVLYEMMTGKPPFAGKEGFARRFTEPAPQPSSARKELPHWVDDAIGRALQRDPVDRYPTADEFVKALCVPATQVTSQDQVNKVGDAGARDSRVEYGSGRAGPPILASGAQEVWENPVEVRRAQSRNDSLGARITTAIRSRPKTAAGLAAATLIVLVAFGTLFGIRKLGAAFEGNASPIDSMRLVILPLAAETRENRVLASHVSEGLYDVLEADWDGLDVVEATKVDELTRKSGTLPVTQSEALKRARQLGARKVVWGQVLSQSRIRATLYDVQSGASEREVSVDRSPEKRSEFAQIATELLKTPGRPTAADGGDGGTRSFPAWRAYGLGHVALAQWDLPVAESRFSAAVQADPTFAAGQVWLAQIRVLRSYSPVEAWSEHVTQALSTPHGLHQRDSSLASALSSMANGAYGNACKSYRQLVLDNARDYIAWYGLGLCGLADKILVRNLERPEQWSFRSSYLRAAQAFDTATQLEPRLFSVLPFDTLLRVAPIEAAQLRAGVTSDKAKEVFLAYPSIIADTLAYTPFPLADIQSGRLRTTPKTAGLAAQQNRTFLLRLVLRWIRQFPASADAQEALSILQEAGGELRVDRGSVPSALTAVLNALRLTTDSDKRAQLLVREVRVRLKRDEFERARELSDSLLASANTSAPSVRLAGLAALTGRLSLTQRLLAPASILVGAYDPNAALPSEAIMSAASGLFVRAALGACSEDLDRYATQLNALFESYYPLRQQDALRQALTQRSWSMATPCRPAFALRVTAPVDRLLRMQQAFARSQPNVVRAEFDSLRRLRENDRPGDVSPDVMYQEAWLLAAIGDTAAAIRKLDLSLSSLPTWGSFILDHVPQAAGLVRAMILRADLAQARGDLTTARKWARAASTLWAHADPSLQRDVSRMLLIAQQRASSADPNQSLRR
jgi:tetratricopeptide (TPR) repeat protein